MTDPQAPDPSSAPPPDASPPPPQASSNPPPGIPDAYPLNLTATYGDGSRSRGIAVLGVLLILKEIALIPHFIVLFFVWIGAFVAAWIGFWAVLFTGNMPSGIEMFVTGTVRWTARVQAWFVGIDDKYPPFSFDADYPVDYTSSVEVTDRSRGWAVLGVLYPLKQLALLPQYLVLWVLGIVAFFAIYIGYWIVLITGKYPDSWWEFILGYYRWSTRVQGMLLGLTDKYPPFRLAE